MFLKGSLSELTQELALPCRKQRIFWLMLLSLFLLPACLLPLVACLATPFFSIRYLEQRASLPKASACPAGFHLLPSLEDKDHPLPDSRGSAIDRLFGLESLQRLSCLGLVYQLNHTKLTLSPNPTRR